MTRGTRESVSQPQRHTCVHVWGDPSSHVTTQYALFHWIQQVTKTRAVLRHLTRAISASICALPNITRLLAGVVNTFASRFQYESLNKPYF